MQVSNPDPDYSSTQPPSRDDSSWPVERIPSRMDAERAHRPLDLGFVQSFRHAILSDAAQDVEYLNDTTEALLRASRPRNLHTYYPLNLATVPPELPLDTTLELLSDAFREQGHPNIPIIQHIPLESFSATDPPEYLAYAIAAIGSMVLSKDPSITHGLWSTANILIASSLELDNREARKVDLINAWVLQATYGALCSEWESWQQMGTTNGYVATAARRLCKNATSGSNSAAMPAFLLADVLRSIHYGDPSTVSIFDCLAQQTAAALAGLKIYKTIAIEGRLPSPEPTKDGPILALIAILANIHTVAHVFHPFSAISSRNMQDASLAELTELINVQNSSIPFSPSNVTQLLHRRLYKALEFWDTAYLSSSDRHTVVLYYFCKMYLTLPSLQILPSLAEYPPRLSSDGKPSKDQQNLVDSELRNAPDAHKYAWQILEYVSQEPGITPSWLPIAVFYASLVMWRTVLLQLDSGGHCSRKVLFLFKAELNKMCWPCCGVMASTLETLLF